MKLGDYVKEKNTWSHMNPWMSDLDRRGLIVETGKYVGNRDVRVMWQDGSIEIDSTKRLEVISEAG